MRRPETMSSPRTSNGSNSRLAAVTGACRNSTVPALIDYPNGATRIGRSLAHPSVERSHSSLANGIGSRLNRSVLLAFDIAPQLLRIGEASHDPGRISGHDCEIGDIGRDDGARSDHGMIADANTADHGGVAAQACVLADEGGQTLHLAVCRRIEVVREHDAVADEHA